MSNEFERRNLDFGGADLAIADFAVACELHPGDSVIDDLHIF
jgi:hypothetical protein